MAEQACNLVHIVQQDVLGIPAYHAHCPACQWRCHRRPHNGIAAAIGCAERHNDKH